MVKDYLVGNLLAATGIFFAQLYACESEPYQW